MDFLECRDKAYESTYTPFGSVFDEIPLKVDFFCTCMHEKGYKLIHVIELPNGVRRAKTLYGGWALAGE
jgi:hypothetical protein